jgi:hypothetical protein
MRASSKVVEAYSVLGLEEVIFFLLHTNISHSFFKLGRVSGSCKNNIQAGQYFCVLAI